MLQNRSHCMTAAATTHPVRLKYCKLRVSVVMHAIQAVTHAVMMFRGHTAACMLQAATCFQTRSVCPGRQLQHALRAGSNQLQQHWHRCQPTRALQASPALRSAVVAAAVLDVTSKAASGNASCVKATFAEAGLSEAAIDRILTQYPYYLRWDVDQKLLPAIQSWQQELGALFLSELERMPTLLVRVPEEEGLKDQYLASIGIASPRRFRKNCPAALRQSLALLKGRVAFLRACGFTERQTLSLLEKHPRILLCTTEQVAQLLSVIGDIFGCAHDMDTTADILLRCNCFRLCSQSSLHRNFTYFCTCLVVDDKEKMRAWKHGVFTVPPAELDAKLGFLAAQLGATIDAAKAVVRRMPQIATLHSATVKLHVAQMLGLGFSHSQVSSMCLRQPSLLTFSYTSEVHIAKWVFLTRVLQLSHDAIAAKPHLLMYSLPNRLGPRWEYLQQLRSHGAIDFTAAHEVIGRVVDLTDSRFRAKYGRPQMRVYDDHFQKQWQRRWDSLLIDQQLSIQDIADNPDVLRT